MKQKVDTLYTVDVLASAFAAYRINSGFLKQTRRFSEEDNGTQFSNKEIMLFSISVTPPQDFTVTTPTEEDKQNVAEAIKFLNKEFSLQIIAGTVNDFIKILLELSNSEKCSTQNFGVLCLLPKVYFETKERKQQKSEIKKNFSESTYIGAVGDKIAGQFTIDSIRFVDKFGCHVLNGHIDKNLVSFFKEFGPGKEIPSVGDTLSIKAKVKKHGNNFVTKIPETLVNYVRFV